MGVWKLRDGRRTARIWSTPTARLGSCLSDTATTELPSAIKWHDSKITRPNAMAIHTHAEIDVSPLQRPCRERRQKHQILESYHVKQ